MNENIFYQQADLLISILPYITKDNDFALHGGTAINFFVRDMPRISVDIDLTYLRIIPRDETLSSISESLKIISRRISSSFPSLQIEEKTNTSNLVTKLFIRKQSAMIKIEPNLIIRGSLFGAEERDLSTKAEEVFEKFVTIKTMAFAELYGSKICAALDRQHPRDIFDTMLLFQNEGITNEVHKAFLVYLIRHNRPISELLSPNFQDIKPVFEKEFAGMALFDVKHEELVRVRETLVKEINKRITDEERMFLLSFKEGSPKWELLGIDGVEKMPAIQWKLYNINKMAPAKHKESVDKLKKVLEKRLK